VNNLVLNGEWLQPERAGDDIDFRLAGAPDFALDILNQLFDTHYQSYDHVAPGHGHQNSRGASAVAEPALRAMMELGFIIDIDHMSNHTIAFVLDQCSADPVTGRPAYPVVSAHTTFRALAPRRRWGDEGNPRPGERKGEGLWPHESSKSDA